MADFEVFKYPLMIREHHLDSLGHVNNATYLELFEEARWEIVSARGFDLQTIHRLNIGPVVLECSLRFFRELLLRQQVIIQSQLLSYNKRIGSMRQLILNEQETICCEATFTFGLFNLSTRKLILPTEQWLKAVGAL